MQRGLQGVVAVDFSGCGMADGNRGGSKEKPQPSHDGEGWGRVETILRLEEKLQGELDDTRRHRAVLNLAKRG